MTCTHRRAYDVDPAGCELGAWARDECFDCGEEFPYSYWLDTRVIRVEAETEERIKLLEDRVRDLEEKQNYPDLY